MLYFNRIFDFLTSMLFLVALCFCFSFSFLFSSSLKAQSFTKGVQEQEKADLSFLVTRYNNRYGTNFQTMDEIVQDSKRGISEYTQALKSCKPGVYNYAMPSPLYTWFFEQATIKGWENSKCIVETRISSKDAISTYQEEPFDLNIKCQYKQETLKEINEDYIDYLGLGFTHWGKSQESKEKLKTLEQIGKDECQYFNFGKSVPNKFIQ